MATEEIKEIINTKRKEVMRRRRTRGEQQFGVEEAEMTRLQEIENEIGSPRARAQYDAGQPAKRAADDSAEPARPLARSQAISGRPGHGLDHRGAGPGTRRSPSPVASPCLLGSRRTRARLRRVPFRVRPEGDGRDAATHPGSERDPAAPCPSLAPELERPSPSRRDSTYRASGSPAAPEHPSRREGSTDG